MVSDLMSSPRGTAIVSVAALVLLILVVLLVGLRRVAPDQALVVPSRRGGQPRVIVGGWALLWPFTRRYRMSLRQQRADLVVEGVDEQMIAVQAVVTASFTVRGDQDGVRRAVQRFWSRPEAMVAVVEESVESAIRSGLGTRSVRETLADRTGLADAARVAVSEELDAQGLALDVLGVGDICTPGTEYLDDLSRVELARVRSAAEVSEAESDRIARLAEIESAAVVAERQHALDLRRAELAAETARAEAAGDGAARIAQAEQDRLVAVSERAALAERALATEERLAIEVRKPAEAERDRLKIVAEGLRAEADARGELADV